MSNSGKALTAAKGGTVTKFKPEEFKRKQRVLSYTIEEAKEIKDWPLLEKAVEKKVEEIKAFLAWWKDTLGKQHGGDRKSRFQNGNLDLSAAQAKEQTGISPVQVSRWQKNLGDEEKYRGQLYGASYRKLMGVDVRGGETVNEWYTPEEYIEAARRAMGGIDLDPASNAVAQEIVRADEYFTVEQNGLLQPWKGRVWLNPPYETRLIDAFIKKLCFDVLEGGVTQAVLLTHNNTDTAWWHRAGSMCSAVCLKRGRINWYDAGGATSSPTQGQTFLYFGDRVKEFVREFEGHGAVFVPRSTPILRASRVQLCP